jgi:hypothetical protein
MVEFELYTNTEVGEYNIPEQDRTIQYWCLTYEEEEQVYIIFVKMNDFSEDEVINFLK